MLVFQDCDKCSSKVILYNVFDNTDLSYYQWRALSGNQRKKSVDKTEKSETKSKMKITVKALIKDRAEKVVSLFDSALKEYMSHLNRINHQYKAMKSLREFWLKMICCCTSTSPKIIYANMLRRPKAFTLVRLDLP